MREGRRDVIDAIRSRSVRLTGAVRDFDRLVDRIGDARFVLLGEASHGTHDFYRARAELTKRLIVEGGFHAVAVEADWPDAYRVNTYVQGQGSDPDAEAALGGFKRFPTWMWRNADVLDFIGWLREHNERSDRRTGFYGLDLYSLRTSAAAVVQSLQRVDALAAERARERYACFERFAEDSQTYGYATGLGVAPSCEDQVLEQLDELRSRAADWMRTDGEDLEERMFSAEQNARLVKNAEAYYRSMFLGRVRTWNMRDEHMVETLEAVAKHLDRRAGRSRIVVWAHNSHLGDARATEMALSGEHNVGQLMRERHREDVVLVGFTTYDGTVTAAADWDAPSERKIVRPALPESWESLFHETGIPAFMLLLSGASTRLPALEARRLERAIGVVYRPDTERLSHYFDAHLPNQFDAVIHLDHTRAVEPLERTAGWTAGEPPETYPFAV